MLTATGVLAIAFGALVVLLPDSAALAPVWSVAAYGVVFGLFLIGFAFGLRRPSTLRSEQSMTVGTDPITA
jgi:uncharacterized membrane protein HdeD (DUF308 family)